jgi:hypothetical protein
MEHEDYKPLIEDVNPENLVGVEIKKGSIEDVKSVFDYDKDSQTIQKEIEYFENEGATPEQEENFGFDDFGEDEEEISNSLSSSGREEIEEEDKGEIEDYYDSAEFVIFITEIILVFATNFYLKYNKLEKITIEAFEKTKSQHKLLVRSWAKVLQKHNAKVSAEMELLFALGSAYGMKMNNIVQQQKALAYDKLMEKASSFKNQKAETMKVVKEVKKEEKQKSSGVAFDVDFESVEEDKDEHKEFRDNMFKKDSPKNEVKTKTEVKKKSTALIDLM